MKEKVAAPVETFPESCEVSAAVCASRAAPNWKASPPLVPCSPEALHLLVMAQHHLETTSMHCKDIVSGQGHHWLDCMYRVCLAPCISSCSV